MIPALNEFTEGEIIQINTDYSKYIDILEIEKVLKLIHLKTISSINDKFRGGELEDIKTFTRNILKKEIFENKEFLHKLFKDKIKKEKVDYLNFYFYDLTHISNKNTLAELTDSYSSPNAPYTNYFNKRQFVKVGNYMFYKHIDKMDKFILLGKFQIDIYKCIENKNFNLDGFNSIVSRAYSTNNPSVFIPTKHFFNRKQYNLKFFRKFLNKFNITVVEDALIDYKIISPKIDSIKSISEKLKLLEIVKEKAITNNFSTNKKLMLC